MKKDTDIILIFLNLNFFLRYLFMFQYSVCGSQKASNSTNYFKARSFFAFVCRTACVVFLPRNWLNILYCISIILLKTWRAVLIFNESAGFICFSIRVVDCTIMDNAALPVPVP